MEGYLQRIELVVIMLLRDTVAHQISCLYKRMLKKTFGVLERPEHNICIKAA